MAPITPCLWFDRNAEEAVDFYLSVFPNSRITQVARYPESDHPAHEGRRGEVLMISFELDGRPFTALNGGPYFKFTEAVSFQIDCKTQDELDRYWDLLSEGGDPEAQQCGWLKDKFGLSWQLVPTSMPQLMGSDDERGARVMKALCPMKKLDIAALELAA
ncbi:MAG: VOC family protein, partial [Verrucomicrobiae bacterium]|nr:VOC family protein [Verrucomicrobiae bacterium]